MRLKRVTREMRSGYLEADVDTEGDRNEGNIKMEGGGGGGESA